MVEVGISIHGDLDFSPLSLRHVGGNIFLDISIDLIPIKIFTLKSGMIRFLCPELDRTRLVVLQKSKNPLKPVQVTNPGLTSESTHGHHSTHDIKSAQSNCPL